MRYTWVALATAGLVSGCGTLPFLSTDTSATNVRQLLRNEENSCRSLGQVEGRSTFGPDQDLYLAALNRARTSVAGKSGNALLVRSYEVINGKGPTEATLLAEAYACPI